MFIYALPLCYNGDIMVFGKRERGKWKRMKDIRAIDMAEYLYSKLQEYGAMTDEIKKILEKIIVAMKDHTFEEMDHIFGIKG